MKAKKLFLLLFVWLFWAAGVARADSAFAAADDAVPLPKYSPGESWVYEALEERAARAGGGSRSGLGTGTYKMEVLGNGTLNLDQIFASVMPSLYEGPTPQSRIEWYRFPLKVGDSWDVRWESRGWFSGTVKVVTKETIKVPAGTFEAYKLVLEAARGNSSMRYEYFYAPSTKAAVKILYKQFGQHSGDVLVTRDVKLTSYSVRN